MAQASITREPIALGYQPGAQNGALTSADLDEISQYQKVINFRDTIVSGKHPRIKVAKPATPQQSQSQSQSTTLARDRVASSSSTLPLQNAPNLNSYQVDNMQSFKTNLQQPAVAVASAASNASIPGVSSSIPLDSAKMDTNSLSHQANAYISKAELQMQRLKLEQELKDEFEYRKALAKAPLQPSEQPVDLDLSDILAKALTLVQATAPPPSSSTPNGGIVSDSSDSFDDNTFYSSPFETPDSPASPRVQNPIRQDVQMQDASTTVSQQAVLGPQQTQSAPQLAHTPASSYQTGLNRSVQPIQTASSSRPPQPNAGGLATSVQDHAIYNSSKTSREGDMMVHSHQARQVDAQVISSDSGAASRSDNSGNTDSDQPADFSRIQNPHQLLPSAHFRQQASPVVRAHDLSPFAPQPAHVSPLAVARRPPIPEPDISILPGAPAQVTALRQEHGVVTSPESSPQGEKGGKKKNKKKNKRKAETRGPDAPGSPYIKPEPRSPSPLSAPQFVRPQKRLRPDPRPGQELVYDEPRIERPVSVVHREQYPSAHVPAERPPYGFERVDDPYARQLRQSVAPASQRLDRGVYEERRPDGTIVQYIQRVQSPYSYPAPYGAVESRPLRSASYSVNPPYRDVPTYPRDGRMSVRPYTDRARSRSPVVVERRSPTMAPPAPPPRILVDQYGREYFDPPRPSAVARHSIVPPPRSSEREVVYERVPLRAPSRMAGETFEEDGIIYRRASPTYAPRRVITQPEYGIDYRSYRERDYSMQPMGAPNQEYIPARGAPTGRAPEEISRDYLPRATSVRPPEAVPYYNRVEAVRPEVPSRRYAASVHPEVRRDAASAVVRDFAARPAERDLPRREFSIQPVERYYDRPPHPEEEVTYIERPRASQQEIIYADNSRRQVYQ
ncbi:hypothetical protein F4774DRAFT_393193 [Daldinia eschscholtzii]|nr:hypothetical protein F4774DRAFT_393193 [Daldinia eschscholtzii]